MSALTDDPSPSACDTSSHQGSPSQALTLDDLRTILRPIFDEFNAIKQQLNELGQHPTLAPLSDDLNDIKEQLQELRLRLPESPSDSNEGEAPVIRYILAKDEDVNKISDDQLTTCKIRETLHKLGSHWKDIKSVTFLKPKVANKNGGKRPCLLFNIDNWKSEDAIRKNAGNISKTLGFSTDCYPIQRRYTVEVLRITDNQHIRGNEDVRALAGRLRFPSNNITARVTFNRFLLDTPDLNTALSLCRKPLELNKIRYDVVPFSPQGTPLFCYNCWGPSHFQEACGFEVVRCGRCAGKHSTKGCSSTTFQCCNCAGDHPAWDQRCTDKNSRREHQSSAWQRHLGPHWASLVHSPSQTKRPTTGEKPPQTDGKPPVPRQKKNATSSATTPGQKRGRPNKFDQKETGQQGIIKFTQNLARNVPVSTPAQPGASAQDMDMTGMDVDPLQELTVRVFEDDAGSEALVTHASLAEPTSDRDLAIDVIMVNIDDHEVIEDQAPVSRSSTPCPKRVNIKANENKKCNADNTTTNKVARSTDAIPEVKKAGDTATGHKKVANTPKDCGEANTQDSAGSLSGSVSKKESKRARKNRAARQRKRENRRKKDIANGEDTEPQLALPSPDRTLTPNSSSSSPPATPKPVKTIETSTDSGTPSMRQDKHQCTPPSGPGNKRKRSKSPYGNGEGEDSAEVVGQEVFVSSESKQD